MQRRGILKNLNTLKNFHVFKNTVKMVHCSTDIKSACIFTQVDRLSVYWLPEWQEYTGGKYWKLKPRRESLRNTYVALVGKEAQWLPKKKSLYLVKLHLNLWYFIVFYISIHMELKIEYNTSERNFFNKH